MMLMFDVCWMLGIGCWCISDELGQLGVGWRRMVLDVGRGRLDGGVLVGGLCWLVV